MQCPPQPPQPLRQPPSDWPGCAPATHVDAERVSTSLARTCASDNRAIPTCGACPTVPCACHSVPSIPPSMAAHVRIVPWCDTDHASIHGLLTPIYCVRLEDEHVVSARTGVPQVPLSVSVRTPHVLHITHPCTSPIRPPSATVIALSACHTYHHRSSLN